MTRESEDMFRTAMREDGAFLTHIATLDAVLTEHAASMGDDFQAYRYTTAPDIGEIHHVRK